MAFNLAQKEQLLQRATIVRQETMEKANTAQRVGSLFYDIIRFLGSMDEDELNQLFLRKDRDDTASGAITFLKGIFAKAGIEVGEFVDSMTHGKGAAIDENGNAQVESLEVRSYMKVMELIINRLSAQEGEYSFTESGTIEKVEQLYDNTYLLTLRKRWEYDFHAFAEGDVVYGSQNTLQADGSYFTSWFRVLETDQAANTITVVTYPDDEVPAGKNFAPVTSMLINRRGNAIDEDRQACWYVSSYEGCIMYLEGVTKPILDETNYYLSLGRPKHLSLFNGLPINYSHPYLFARGAIIQDLLRVDFKGNPVYEIVDVGLWSERSEYLKGLLGGKYVQHQVWWNGVCWRCIVEKATVGVAPVWNSTEWIAITGNYSVSLNTADGQHFFRGSDVYTTLVATVKHGEADISSDVTPEQVQWSRISTKAEEDLAWNIRHKDSGLTLQITPADLPSDFLTVRQVSYKVIVSVRPGSEAVAQFNFKL